MAPGAEGFTPDMVLPAVPDVSLEPLPEVPLVELEPGPPIELVPPDVAPPVLPLVEPLLAVPLLEMPLPEVPPPIALVLAGVPVLLGDVVLEELDDVVGVAGSCLVQAPSETAATSASAAYEVRVAFMVFTP
ncbi:MAG: hypothetical protein JWQ07_2962 [Ramlibacter sp.]|nr:hypothetical protein [Ramlibacter sp.]